MARYVADAADAYLDLAQALVEEVEGGGATLALDAAERVDRARAFINAARHNVPSRPHEPASLQALAAAVSALSDGGAGADVGRAVNAVGALAAAKAALEAEGAWVGRG